MGNVQVILSEDVQALGDAGEIVTVKPGYARNYLIPQGKAMIATAERVNEVEHQKRVISEKLAKELKDRCGERRGVLVGDEDQRVRLKLLAERPTLPGDARNPHRHRVDDLVRRNNHGGLRAAEDAQC